MFNSKVHYVIKRTYSTSVTGHSRSYLVSKPARPLRPHRLVLSGQTRGGRVWETAYTVTRFLDIRIRAPRFWRANQIAEGE